MAELVAILKLLPALLKLIDKMASAYVAFRIGQMDKAIEEGIRKAVKEQDQRDLEKAIGNNEAGEPTNYPGTGIVDSLPGVHQPQKDQSGDLAK